MEYFQLTVRTGVPGYVDEGGGIHIDGFPQLIGLRRLGRVAVFMQKIFGAKCRDRRDVVRVTQVSVFNEEFMIEVPLDVDVSPITGIKNWGIARLKIARPQDMDDHEAGEVL